MNEEENATNINNNSTNNQSTEEDNQEEEELEVDEDQANQDIDEETLIKKEATEAVPVSPSSHEHFSAAADNQSLNINNTNIQDDLEEEGEEEEGDEEEEDEQTSTHEDDDNDSLLNNTKKSNRFISASQASQINGNSSLLATSTPNSDDYRKVSNSF